MSKTIEMNLDPKFEVGDRVRVVVSNSNFFGWTGEVKASYKGDFEFGAIHYHVLLDNFAMLHGPINIAPLLFREFDLAHSL